MTIDELQDMDMLYSDTLIADVLVEAVIGLSTKGILIYDVDKAIKVLMEESDMCEEAARDYFYYNVEGAYVGEFTPIYVHT